MSELTTRAINNLVFSSDEFTNSSIKYGLAGALRDVLSEDLRPQAKAFFLANGVDEAVIDQQFGRAIKLFNQIEETATVEAHATARQQTVEAKRQAALRKENKLRLAGVGASLASAIALKNGAKAAQRAVAKTVPQNIAPNISEQTSLGNLTGKELTPADVVAANKAGIRLGASIS